MSKDAVETHYLKHHSKYVDNLNKLLSNTNVTYSNLEDIISNVKDSKIYNNAAQTYNHNLFWYSITSKTNSPKNILLQKINTNFGSLDNLLNQFISKGIGHFGSGWIYLTKLPDGNLILSEGHDAESPIKNGQGIPILALDLWEHAYYVDYRNDRERFIRGWIEHINWDTAELLYNTIL